MDALSNSPQKKTRVAVVLAGCGAKDGSEITEAVALLIALSQRGIAFDCFAPDRNTYHVVDHLSGKENAQESRNQLHEAARIARGKVHPLSQLLPQSYDAVALAGGFGAAKNLCNYAFAGADASLEADVKKALLPFLQQKKPMAALCIAPVILALLCREANIKGAQLTLGDGSAEAAVQALKSWGATHMPTRRDEACIDSVHQLVSAPAYMFDDATPADIFNSASALVTGLHSLMGRTSSAR
jgi:enhancing lycopene biosynthesis protein 2